MTPHPRQIALLRQKGAAAREAHLAVSRAFAAGVRSQAPRTYAALLSAFRAATAAATPVLDLEAIVRGDPKTVNRAIAFLAADPYFFRSGYLKTALLRKLKRAALTDEQKATLARLVLDRVNMPHGSNRRDFGRLAAALRWPALDRELVVLLDRDDQAIRRRAQQMLAQIVSARDVLAG